LSDILALRERIDGFSASRLDEFGNEGAGYFGKISPIELSFAMRSKAQNLRVKITMGT
jgi:hypothetical protein